MTRTRLLHEHRSNRAVSARPSARSTNGLAPHWKYVFAGVLLVCGGCGGGGVSEKTFPYPQAFINATPSFGSTAGGTQVTLRGRGFLHPFYVIRDVHFAGRPATEWTILNDQTILVESPPGLAGSTAITILGDNAPGEDNVLLTRGFTYRAPVVFVADGLGSAAPSLYAVNLDANTPATVGPIGFAIESMAMNSEGQLYGVEAESPYRLIRISTTSGAGTSVAEVHDGPTGDAVVVRDVSFVDDRLLGRTAANELVEIDLVSGTVTSIGFIASAVPGGGMAMESMGSVFMADPGPSGQLYLLDVLTGSLSPGPILDRVVTFRDLSSNGGTLYAIDASLPGSGEPGLVRLETDTGDVAPVTALPPGTTAVAHAP